MSLKSNLVAGVALALVLATAGAAAEIPVLASRHDAAYGRWGFDDSGVDPTAVLPHVCPDESSAS